jgi:SOS-response transcriptional repressor LexA
MSVPQILADVYTLTMPDSALCGDGLFEGDTLYISQNQTPMNGQVAVAWLDEEHYAIRQFYQTGNMVQLVASDGDTEPITIEASKIQSLGVVTMFARHLR